MSFKSGFESRESQFNRAGGSELQVKYWPRNRCSQWSGWDWRMASGTVRTGGSMFWSWTRRMRHCRRTGGNSWPGPWSKWLRRHWQSRSILPVWKTGERRRKARRSSLGIEPPSPATSVPVPEINIPSWNWPSCCLSALKSSTVNLELFFCQPLRYVTMLDNELFRRLQTNSCTAALWPVTSKQ